MKANSLLRIQAILTDLASCLCGQLNADGQTKTCFCGVVTGATDVNDTFSDCENLDGRATVRLAGAYPAETAGEAATRKQNLKLGIGIDIELKIERTIDIDPDDLTISEAQHLAMVTQEVLDMKAVFQAVGCCEGFKANDVDVLVGTWTPLGPQGMVYGGTLPIFVKID